jgi:hypothetical protein
LFLAGGEETEAVDVLHYLWQKQWPDNRSPRITGVWLDNKTASQNVHLKAGETYPAKVSGEDPDHDPLQYSWEVLEESTAQSTGGDFESKPRSLPGLMTPSNAREITLQAPRKPGAYRLFAYIRDGRGHAAHGNIPFCVDPDGPHTPGKPAATASPGHSASR